MRVRALVVVASLLAGLPAAGATASAPMPAARRWVAMGLTNSIAGPRRTVLALRGHAPPHRAGDHVVLLAPARARRLFGLVRGSRRTGPPVAPPTGCADCGTAFSQADGRWFAPSRAFTREFARVLAR